MGVKKNVSEAAIPKVELSLFNAAHFLTISRRPPANRRENDRRWRTFARAILNLSGRFRIASAGSAALEYPGGRNESFKLPIPPNVSTLRRQQGREPRAEKRDFPAIATHLEPVLINHAEVRFDRKIGARAISIDYHPCPTVFLLITA